MSDERERLKNATVALLDAIADEHLLKHQCSKAQRYVLTSQHEVGQMIDRLLDVTAAELP